MENSDKMLNYMSCYVLSCHNNSTYSTQQHLKIRKTRPIHRCNSRFLILKAHRSERQKRYRDGWMILLYWFLFKLQTYVLVLPKKTILSYIIIEPNFLKIGWTCNFLTIIGKKNCVWVGKFIALFLDYICFWFKFISCIIMNFLDTKRSDGIY